MRMPGFAAEATLYKASGQYCTARIYGDSGAFQGVLPQLARQVDECYAWCNLSGEDPLTCFFRCGSGDGGGGNGGGDGGGGESCRPGCGPCRRVGSRWQRVCVNADCDTRTVACRH
jgi:hypothetical protein